jgi:hypothetical protein
MKKPSLLPGLQYDSAPAFRRRHGIGLLNSVPTSTSQHEEMLLATLEQAKARSTCAFINPIKLIL